MARQRTGSDVHPEAEECPELAWPSLATWASCPARHFAPAPRPRRTKTIVITVVVAVVAAVIGFVVA